MIENYRTGSVWSRVMQNADVQRGLGLAGFQAASGVDISSNEFSRSVLFQNSPNPFRTSSTIRYELAENETIRLDLHDVSGRVVRRLVHGFQTAGGYEVTLSAKGLPAGVYFYRLEMHDSVESRKLLVLR